MIEKRSFTVIKSDSNRSGGRYLSFTPMSAARKAANKLLKNTNKNTVNFDLGETTQHSQKKVFSYVAKRIVLSPPLQIVKGDTVITIRHKLVVKKR